MTALRAAPRRRTGWIKALVGATLISSLGASAQAAVLVSFAGPTLPETTDSVHLQVLFSGDAGPAEASFTLDGYDSLDGQGFFEDDFTLTLNGLLILKGTYDLGGGGADVTYLKPVGATITNLTVGARAGGKVLITTPLSLSAGTNDLRFYYAALPAPDHAGFQGRFDERWGFENLLITQGAVPEPTTWGLVILGLGAAGSMLRRQQRRTPEVGQS